MSAISRALYDKKGHVYVCGEVQMAMGVITTLEFIFQMENNMSAEESKEYIQQLKQERRLHLDVFGNTFKKSSPEIRAREC